MGRMILNGTVYGAGSKVEANPSETATNTLQKVGIDGVIYEIQGGGGGGSNLIVDAQIYSTDEKVVGVWIDNKPLYQKTYLFNSLTNVPSGRWFDTGFTATDISIVGDAYGFYQDASAGVAVPILASCDSGTNQPLYIYLARNASTEMHGFTIQYTKTTDAAGSGGYQAWGFSPIIYSTEEREVGVWTDNKPLYQKTVRLTSFIDGGSTSLGITDIETIVDYTVMAYRGNNDNGWSDNNSVGNEELVTINSDGGLYYRSSNSHNSLIVTIWYTKSTDTPGSGSYNTLGVPTVHYSTDEQVIGTWFNKPLYQKTITIPNQHVTETMEIDFAQYISNIDLIWADLDHSYIDETLQSTHYYRDFTTWKGLYDSAGATKIIRFMGGVSYESGITYDLVFTVNYTKTTD